MSLDQRNAFIEALYLDVQARYPVPLEEEPVILKSATCACYRDDDGLHPCADLEWLRKIAHLEDAQCYDHIIEAFGLDHYAPEPPQRAVKMGEHTWQAPCGCQVDFDPSSGKEHVTYRCRELRDYGLPLPLDHIAQAVAAVMREQTPPMPTSAEIDLAFNDYGQRRLKTVGPLTPYGSWHAAVAWVLERKP